MTTSDPASSRVYGGRSAAERDADRRRRLLDAALEVFGTEGYAATSIERLCSAAKVSTRHFYLLYAQKEDVLVELYTELSDASYVGVAAVLERTAGESVQVRLEQGLSAYLRPLLADPRAARVAFVEIVGVSARMEAYRVTARNAIVGVVEAEGAAAVERGELEPRDFRFLGMCLSGAINVTVHDWSLHADADADGTAALELERRLIAVGQHLVGEPRGFFD